MSETNFRTKADILADLWMNFRNDEDFTDFISYNDLGLPLAYLISNEIVNGTAVSTKFINETYALLLASLEIEDNEYETIDDLFMASTNNVVG